MYPVLKIMHMLNFQDTLSMGITKCPFLEIKPRTSNLNLLKRPVAQLKSPTYGFHNKNRDINNN